MSDLKIKNLTRLHTFEVTDNDDGSTVKFNTMVTITSFDTYDIVSFMLIFLCAPICQVAGTYILGNDWRR